MAIATKEQRLAEEIVEEELADQLDKLPPPDEVAEVLSALRVATLREFATEVANGGIAYAKGNIGRLEYATLLNSWLATAEETAAAGRNLSRIAARRKHKG